MPMLNAEVKAEVERSTFTSAFSIQHSAFLPRPPGGRRSRRCGRDPDRDAPIGRRPSRAHRRTLHRAVALPSGSRRLVLRFRPPLPYRLHRRAQGGRATRDRPDRRRARTHSSARTRSTWLRTDRSWSPTHPEAAGVSSSSPSSGSRLGGFALPGREASLVTFDGLVIEWARVARLQRAFDLREPARKRIARDRARRRRRVGAHIR